jgi:hypothetical protein
VASLRDGEDGSGDGTMLRTIRSMAFAPTPPNVRQILAVASFDGSISIWEGFTSQTTLNGDSNNLDMDTNWKNRAGGNVQLNWKDTRTKSKTSPGMLPEHSLPAVGDGNVSSLVPEVHQGMDPSKQVVPVQAMKGILNVWQYSNLTPGISRSGRDVRCSLVHSGYKSANGW